MYINSRLRRLLRYNGINKLYSIRWLTSCLDFGEYVISLRFLINPSLINKELSQSNVPCFNTLNYLELDLPANDTLEWYTFLHGLNPTESVEGSTKLTQYFKTRLFEFFAFCYPLYKMRQQKRRMNRFLKIDDFDSDDDDDDDTKHDMDQYGYYDDVDCDDDDTKDDMDEYVHYVRHQKDNELALYDNDFTTIVLDDALLLYLHDNVFLKRFEKREIVSILKRYYPLMYLSFHTNHLILNLN